MAKKKAAKKAKVAGVLIGILSANLQQLATEINTDPRAYGYSTHVSSGNDQALADLLNLPRDGANGGPAIPIRREAVPVKSVIESITVSDFPSLPGNPTAAQLSDERRKLAWLTMLASLDTVRILNNDGTNGPVAVNLLAIFPAGSATRDRLVALGSRNGSRAEELWGAETVVTTSQIAQALRGG